MMDLEDALKEMSSEGLQGLVLDGSGIGDVDASGAAELGELVESFRDKGVKVALAAWRGPVRDMLERAHVLDDVTVTVRVEDAVRALTSDEDPGSTGPRGEDAPSPALKVLGGVA